MVHALQLTIKGLNVTAVKNKKAFSLAEMMVVITIIAILATIVIPSARTLIESFEMTSQINPVIGAALANARAIAMKEQKYAGIRFQQDLSGNQYMILIIDNELSGTPANGFKAVAGRKPMKLPEAIGVMDFKVVTRVPVLTATDTAIDDDTLTDAEANDLINDQFELNDVVSFSLVFSPSGKLATRMVQVWNRDKALTMIDSSKDDVFNTLNNVDQNNVGKFVQDDYWRPADNLGWGFEFSRKSFVVYKKSRLKEAGHNRRWSTYLNKLKRIYVNPYSGQIISD
jgi:prepilin-type N-terminal cleavage/methylation domain-containing protein